MQSLLSIVNRLLILIVLVTGLPGAAQAAPEEVRFGALLHLTGEFATYGVAFREGAELAAHEINERRELPNVVLKVVFEDTEYKPQQAHSGAKKLVFQDKVVAAIVSTLTEIESAGPVFEKAKIPAVVLWDAGKQIDDLGDYIFSIGPSAELSGQTVARFSKEQLKAQRAVVLSSNTSFSLAVSRSFSDAFRGLGGSIVDEVSFNPDEIDFRTSLQRIKKVNFDLAYAPIDAQMMAFYKQWRQAKFEQPVVSTDIITEDNLVAASALFEGVFQSMTADPMYSATRAMLDSYREYFGRECQQILLTAWGYDGIRVLAEAFKKAASSDLMKEELYKLKDFEGATGRIAFSSVGSSPRVPSMFKVVDGKFSRVSP
ncbi:MAG: ABC transporter substrate-binding protein [Oligoflexia bacterium]|nr:ABC transporter substrate-binding protein [Oligoflexia bacterium]